MKLKTLTGRIVLFAAASTFIACGGGEEAPQGPKYNFERADSLPSGYLEELGIIKTNIEVTAKLYEDMNKGGYSFSESALMSSGKSFSGSSKQAMGIGAIGTDMVYCAAFGQNQSAMSRMEGLISTANSLGVAEAFDQELMQQMASEDTTINKSILLTKAYLKAKDQLFSDERAQYATFMVVGGWLEGLHIATQMGKDNIANMDVRLGIWSMCEAYANVIHMCEVFKSNSEMTATTAQLKELGAPVSKIVKNSKKYSETDIQELADAVSKIRSSMY